MALPGRGAWRVENAPKGASANPEFLYRRYKLDYVVTDDGDERQDTIAPRGSADNREPPEKGMLAPACTPAEEAEKSQRDMQAAVRDRRTFTIDQSFAQPTKLDIADYSTMVALDVDDHPCDPPDLPVTSHPVDTGHPFWLLKYESMGACPKTLGVPFHVRVVGYRPE